jgi:xanthine dehydrogenase molybdenum-binding subunit
MKEIDISRAKVLEGVWAVLTAKDIPGERNHGLIIRDWPVLVGVDEKVRYIGDAVALVAAESREIAEQALGLIEVRYEQLSVVSGPIEARKEDAPKVHKGGNLLKHIEVSKGDIDQGFREAEVIIEGVYHTPIYDHAFMEPECSIARPIKGDRIEIYTGSQIPYEDKKQVAACLGLDPERVRVIGTLIGGAFGGKEDIAGQVHAALLAQATGSPVKMLYNRRESLQVHPKRHATQIDIRLGAKRDGTLVATQIELHGDTGAYASLGQAVMTRATTHSTGPYFIPHVQADCYAMYTNNPPAGACRGFGVLQSAFAIESAMDQLAERLGIDPIEIRRKNALREGTVTVTGQLLKESVGLVECIERVDAEIRQQTKGYEPFTSQPVDGDPNLRRAWGFAAAYKNTGLGGGLPDQAEAEVELYRDGTIEVRTSSAEVGQGLPLVLQMIAAEEFGLPLEKIRVLLSDTDLTPDGGPTTASRQTYISGNAVKGAACLLHQAINVTLSEKFDCPPEDVKFIGSEVHVNRHRILLGEVVDIMKAEGRKTSISFTYTPPATKPLGEGGDMHIAFGFAAYAVEVEVNIATGEVNVLRVVAACDVGKAINPIGLIGQIEGGVMMGLGHALTEEFIAEEGIVFTDRLALYRMPSIKHTPDIIPIIVECPTVEGPYGAKGVGEVTTIPMPAAITNAIYNTCGVRVQKLPVDQDWLALQLAG